MFDETNVSSPPEGFAGSTPGSTADVIGRIVFEKTGGSVYLTAFHDETRTAIERVQTRPGGPYVAMRGPISRHISARFCREGTVIPLEANFPIWFDATPRDIAEKIVGGLRYTALEIIMKPEGGGECLNPKKN